MTDIKLIDTNILVYAIDEDEGNKHKKAKDIISKYVSNQNEMALSTQNISEFFVVSTEKIHNPIPKDYAKIIINTLIKLPNIKILIINDETIIEAIELSERYNISYWDALIASTMIENNIFTIYTENEKDFKKIPGLTVINPLKY